MKSAGKMAYNKKGVENLKTQANMKGTNSLEKYFAKSVPRNPACNESRVTQDKISLRDKKWKFKLYYK
jgi:hypothetical protein